MKAWIIVLIASLCIATGTEAVAGSPVWLSLGGGGAGHSGRGMGGGRLGVHWWQGKGLWTVSLRAFEEVDILGIVSPHENVVEFGVLYGQRFGGRVGFVSTSAGLSVLSGVRRGHLIGRSGWIFASEEYEARHFTTVGVPLNVEFALLLSSAVGLAVDGCVNFNPEYTLSGVTLSLLVGKLR